MKDAKGHGSNARLEGGAAHQRMVRKTLEAGDTHRALAHSLTRYDREQEHKASQGRGSHNPYALGLYLGRAQDVADAVKGGTKLGDAINQHFNGPLANRLHRDLGTGMKSK